MKREKEFSFLKLPINIRVAISCNFYQNWYKKNYKIPNGFCIDKFYDLRPPFLERLCVYGTNWCYSTTKQDEKCMCQEMQT